MKTTIGVQKTENRNMKTSNMKTFVVLIGVALIVFMGSVHATENKGMIVEGNQHFLALASVGHLAPTSVSMHSAAAALEVMAEEMLEVESWMIHESYFASLAAVAESEESLSVEDWMLSEPHFSALRIVEEGEKTLEVEDWMMNASVWGN